MQCLILSIKRNTFCIHGCETIASVTRLPDVSATVCCPTWSGCDSLRPHQGEITTWSLPGCILLWY
ncbi:hypothetical protein Hanom_Chr15g01385901 [Helianthus anomalus]